MFSGASAVLPQRVFPERCHSVLRWRRVQVPWLIHLRLNFHNLLMPYYILPGLEERKFEAEIYAWFLEVVHLPYPFGIGVDDFLMVELVWPYGPRSTFT